MVKNLSLLIKSGKPINESFELLAEQSRVPALTQTLEKAQEKVEKGTSLYEIFDENPYFGRIFVSFIRAGEESGTLEENLENLGSWLERSSKLKEDISSATLYPKLILGFAVLLAAGLSIFILPDLVSVFNSLDVELHITTRMLLGISETMQESGLFVFGGLAAFGVAVWLLLKVEPIKKLWHSVQLRMPIAKGLVKEYQLTVIAQLISTLFASGLPITDSLEIVSQSVTNIRYREAMEKIKIRTQKGVSLGEALSDYPNLFPSVFVSVVLTGEETGSYEEGFSYLADFFSTRVSRKTEKLPVVLEPVILIFLGVMVAFLAFAIILPVYEVTHEF